MQGDGPFPDGINVTIRRNYIYEDAYDKLSPENGTGCTAAVWRRILCVHSSIFRFTGEKHDVVNVDTVTETLSNALWDLNIENQGVLTLKMKLTSLLVQSIEFW